MTGFSDAAQIASRDQARGEPAQAPAPAAPMEIEVTRGAMVESRHRVRFAVSDGAGRLLRHGGDPEAPIYARSAIKPLQALALVETGAAEAYGLGDAEIALACASHAGEPRHIETVTAWLERIGLAIEDLECGAHLPSREPAAHAMIRHGAAARAIHNNCSGKHSGFLTTALQLGAPTEGYIRYEHPVQQRVLGILESLTGLDLGGAPRGIDGCGIPVIGIPLGNIALAFARFAAPDDQPEARQAACARIRRAMAAEPFMVAGTGRFCTDLMTATGETVLVKTGAEGVYCAALPTLGLGIALKAEDGAGRAAECAMAGLLRELGVLSEAAQAALTERFEKPLRNWAGTEVGRIKPATSA